MARFSRGDYIDITGQRFGMLTVIGFSHFSEAPSSSHLKNGRRTHWLCRCDCGNEVVRRKDALNSGRALDTTYMSCGCMSKEVNRQRFIEEHKQGINPAPYGDDHWTHKEPERAKAVAIKNLGEYINKKGDQHE